MRRRRTLLRNAAFVLLPVLLLSLPAAADSQPPASAEQVQAQPAELLKALDDAAIAAYVAGRSQTLADHDGPVIIVADDMVLLANGTETHADYTPDGYTELKTISHITLGVVGLLHAYADDPAAGAAVWKPLLEKLLAQVRAVEPILGTLSLGADAHARDAYIVQRMIAFMEATLARGSYTRDELTAAARDVAPYLLASASEAAKYQIERMDGIVRQWRAELSPEQWSRLRVFVLGPHMPREGYLQFNYFRFLMGDAAVGKTLIYGENIFSQKGATKLLATVLQDRAIAKITFDDEMRMDRDLLADGAEAELLRLFGKLGTPAP
ncbi:hypothetical protein [Ancylobacter mangrovi]|uniref:hypothetical protein n=1 Tax=Ancylobacter mangrovi TaxID=2972472 RepID=UPI00216270D2|nr:hypothetical protein [Ancylobacter mangrovi]MCS0502686.1 hypothetical protein [Ancylobacter mangrovi]